MKITLISIIEKTLGSDKYAASSNMLKENVVNIRETKQVVTLIFNDSLFHFYHILDYCLKTSFLSLR